MPLKSCDLGSVYFAERASRRTATFTKYARPTQRALPVMANSMWLRVWRHGCKRLKHVGLLCRSWDLSCIRQSYLTVEKIGGTSRVVLPPLLLYTSGCIVLWISQRESLTIHTFFLRKHNILLQNQPTFCSNFNSYFTIKYTLFFSAI